MSDSAHRRNLLGPLFKVFLELCPVLRIIWALGHTVTQWRVSSSSPEIQKRGVGFSLRLVPCDLQAALLFVIFRVTRPFIERLRAPSLCLPPSLCTARRRPLVGLRWASSHSLCHQGSELQRRRPVRWSLGMSPPVPQSECPVTDRVGVGWAVSSDASVPYGHMQPLKTDGSVLPWFTRRGLHEG